jgi:hypothetical protein
MEQPKPFKGGACWTSELRGKGSEKKKNEEKAGEKVE